MEQYIPELERSIGDDLEGLSDEADASCVAVALKDMAVYEKHLEKMKGSSHELREALQEMKSFCDTKKNMFLPIRVGLEKALGIAEELTSDINRSGAYFLNSLESVGETAKRRAVVGMKKDKAEKDTIQCGTQTEDAVISPISPIFHDRKRERETTLSPVEVGPSRQRRKQPRVRDASTPTTSFAVETAGELQTAPSRRRKKRSRRARPEAVLIKPAEGRSYAQVLTDLKAKVNPDALGVHIRGVRETRHGDVLVEVGPAAGGRGKLSAAIKEAVGTESRVQELVPRVEVEILDLEKTTKMEEVEAAVRRHFKEVAGEVRVSLTKKPFRGSLRAFVEMGEELAARLVRTGHLKIGWVSCRVRRKLEVARCYRCLGFGHMAASCTGPNRAGVCWRCGKEGHKAAVCVDTPQCFLCAENVGKPRTDHRPGTMSCLTFREATLCRKPPE